MSGFSRNELADELVAEGALGFLPKPFNTTDLAEALEQALDAKAGKGG